MKNHLSSFLYLLFIILFSTSCTMIKTIQIVNSGEAVENRYTESVVPFTFKEHLILIKARINNSRKEYTFVFDTGAFTIVKISLLSKMVWRGGASHKASDHFEDVSVLREIEPSMPQVISTVPAAGIFTVGRSATLIWPSMVLRARSNVSDSIRTSAS